MRKPIKAVEGIWSAAMAPISPKNLRMSAILIAVYQVLIAHVVLFIMLLGLAHAEQMKAMLAADMEENQEEEIYGLTVENMNQVHLKAAADLVSVTEVMLYIGTAIASVYLLSCLGLFVGVFKHRSELILPWLIVDLIGIILILVVMWTQNERFLYFVGGRTQYWTLCIAFTLFDVIIWYIVHAYYLSLRQMRKLTEIATVAIPCPPPGIVPFHFRKENMYLGSGEYKHMLTDGDPNQKI